MEGKSSISPMRRSSGLPSARATDGGYVEENDDITCKISGIIAICQNFLASSGKLRPFISSHGLSIPEKLIISFDDDYNDLSRLVNSLVNKQMLFLWLTLQISRKRLLVRAR